MFCLVPKVMSSNPDPPRENWVIKSLCWHRKMVAVKPRQSEKNIKGSEQKKSIIFIFYFQFDYCIEESGNVLSDRHILVGRIVLSRKTGNFELADGSGSIPICPVNHQLRFQFK